MKGLAVITAFVFFFVPMTLMVISGYITAGQALAGVDTLYEVGVVALSALLPLLVFVGAFALVGVFALVGIAAEWITGRG